jgi:tetratricopeptide (TPR) repeat protein
MPEKQAHQVSRALRELFDKGATALQRENYDYAISILNAVLDKEPGFFECREHLRVAQHKKAANEKGFFKKVFSGASAGGLIPKGQLALRRNPAEAMSIAEQILNGDPTSTSGHKLLVEAALAADLPKTAIFSLEILLKHSPRDRKLREHMAEACMKAGEIQRAEGILEELEREFPNDPELKQRLKNISAQKTLTEAGYEKIEEGGTSFRDFLKDKEEAQVLEDEKREVKAEDQSQRLIHEYESRLKHEPKNMKIRRQLAELYRGKGRFDESLAAYEEIKKSDVGNDASLDREIAETVIRRFNHQIESLDSMAPDHAEQKAKLEADRQEFRIDECRKRVERFPTDLGLRFELGEMYYNAGKLNEAIAELQKAQNNPHRRTAAMGLLGQSFARKGMNELAARTLRNAIREKQLFDDEKKELLYSLGCLLEKMGKPGEAKTEFEQIYEVDISYKDVAAKMDAYYSAQS